ncbi:LPS-assembly protein LptD [Thermodesulfobacteriota bacterium]
MPMGLSPNYQTDRDGSFAGVHDAKVAYPFKTCHVASDRPLGAPLYQDSSSSISHPSDMAPAVCSEIGDIVLGSNMWIAPRVLMVVAVFILAVGLTSNSAAAEESKPESSVLEEAKRWTILPGDKNVEIWADRLGYNHEKDTYTARGNVTFGQGNFRARADTLVINARQGVATAKGRVIVRQGSDVLEAEKIVFKLPEATGVIFNGKLLFTGQNVYMEAKKAEKLGPSRYRLEDGSFTTCNGATPDWRISAKNLELTLGGYGTLKHGFFYIKDIPVFYIPWMIYPVKSKRQTGLLAPSLSNSSLRGFDFKLPFFWNISPSMDLTLVPRICTKRAFQTSLEYRYVPFEDFRGRLYGEYTYDWNYGPEDSPRSHRFYVTWRHYQDVLDLLRLKVNGVWISDRDYFEFWGGTQDRRKRVRYLESNAVLYRQWENFLFQAEARHFDNLTVPDNSVTVQNLPIVTGTLFNQQIPYTPFYLSSSVVYDNFFAPSGQNRWIGSRLKADTRLRLPLALGRYLKLEPSMTYIAKAYAADYYEKERSLISVNTIRTDLYRIDANLFTDLQSVYKGSFLGFQRVKHSIRPRFNWTYIPRTDQGIYPRFDETDRVGQVSLLTGEIRQTLTGRLGPRDYLDFVTLSIAQGYDFNKHAAMNSDDPPEFSMGYGWTNTQAQLTLRPHSLVDLVASAEYDPMSNRARRYSFNLGLMDHRGDTLRVLHQFTEDKDNRNLNSQTNLSLLAKLTSSLDCFFENQYTHQFRFSYMTGIGLIYHPQCWNVVLKYSEQRRQDPITQRISEPDQTVFVTLSLYGLGQVYRMTQDWRAILGAPPVSLGSPMQQH